MCDYHCHSFSFYKFLADYLSGDARSLEIGYRTDRPLIDIPNSARGTRA
jgi:hypothetical protein